MAAALKPDWTRCRAPLDAEGMYVVDNSRAADLPVPHLPSLVATPSGAWSIRFAFDMETKEVIDCQHLLETFDTGDIVWVDPHRGVMQTVLSSRSRSNTLLLTEQCENRCLFCAQPPKDRDDCELYERAALALLNFHTDEFVGLSGGEPTKSRDAFLCLLGVLQNFASPTKLHILSHGRTLRDRDFARHVSEKLGDRAVLWGIPLYGHTAMLHDALVGQKGAFSDTIRGLSNLASLGQEVELRIVPIKQNLEVLSQIVSFIALSYLPIRTVSIMHLEPKGLARKNYALLYVPLREQVPHLERAVEIGERYGLSVRLFNYPLCVLSENLRSRAAQSISEWKNYYPAGCDACRLREECGGFFTSATGRFLEPVEAL